jgi:hypothetical protein
MYIIVEITFDRKVDFNYDKDKYYDVIKNGLSSKKIDTFLHSVDSSWAIR